MIRPADILAVAIQLTGTIPERAARDALLAQEPKPVDGNELIRWLEQRFQHLKFSDYSLWERAQSLIDSNLKARIRPIGIGSPEYPKYLRLIADPPPVLFVKGEISVLHEKGSAAIVGTREATATGTEIAKRISITLGERGWCVVSGLALGIDAAAHEGALLSGAKTVAVLAHGLKQASPRANSHLAEQILSTGGAWVSEHSVEKDARREYFVRRNRIQIGISCGSIIVEAALKSGSMAQANYCVSEKRPLFAVLPHAEGNPLGLRCEGTADMVNRLGAIPIKTKQDYQKILDTLELANRTLHGHSNSAHSDMV